MSEITQKVAMDLGTPATQDGVRPDLPSDVGGQSVRIATDGANIAGAPSGPEGTSVVPEAVPYGPGSLGSDVEGWHPAEEG